MSNTLQWSIVLLLAAGCSAPVADTTAGEQHRPPASQGDQPFWPQFHGPNRDNLSGDTGLLKSWPEGGPKEVWTTKGLGFGYSSVSIAGGRIFTAGNLDDRTVVTALDLRGKILWQVPCGKAWTKSYEGTRGTPTIDGDRLYFESPLGEVVCLAVESGRKIWGLNILEAFHSQNTTWALAESLLIDGDRVICTPGGPQTAMVALHKMTGKPVWKSPTAAGELAGYSSPVLVELQGLRIIITMTQQALIGVDADTGNLLWRFKHVTRHDENIITPVCRDGCVFISTIFNAASVKLKIHVNGKKAEVRELWRSNNLDSQHGGVVLLGNYLYGASRTKNGAKWICLDWKTGRMAYAEKGAGRGSLTYADGMLYTLSERRKMSLVRPMPSHHEILSSFRIPDQGKGPTWAHPVVCGGWLSVRHGEYLYTYDVRAEQ